MQDQLLPRTANSSSSSSSSQPIVSVQQCSKLPHLAIVNGDASRLNGPRVGKRLDGCGRQAASAVCLDRKQWAAGSAFVADELAACLACFRMSQRATDSSGTCEVVGQNDGAVDTIQLSPSGVEGSGFGLNVDLCTVPWLGQPLYYAVM